MIYLKSIMAGIVALFFAGVIVYAIAFLAILVIFRPDAIDLPIWHVHTRSVAFWVFATVVFTLGFVWEFRRLSS